MSKAKIPKLRLPLLNTIQICRPKVPSSMVMGPLPFVAADYFSPCSSTLSFRLSIPSFPDPTSTPDNHSIKHNALSSKSCGGPSKPYKMRGMKSELVDDYSSHEYCSRTRKSGKTNVCISSSPCNHPTIENKQKESSRTRMPNAKPSKTVTEEEPLCRSMKPTRFRTQRFEEGSKRALDQSQSREQKHVARTMIQRRVDKRVNEEGFVVVKRSEDPYEDFKKSMLEMIVEKQMFEPKELEQLLMSFISLNSRLHHRVILQAFAEILKEAFSGSSG